MKLNDKEIDIIFDTLYKQCSKKGAYCIQEVSEKMGVNYDQIIAWSKKNIEWNYVYELSKQSCFCQAELDGFKFKLEPEKSYIYMLATSDDFLSAYPTIEDQVKLIDETIKEDFKGKKLNKRQREEKERRIREAKQLYEKLFPQKSSDEILINIYAKSPNDN